jgi:hypothetical protein
MFGAIGACLVGALALLLMRLPQTAAGRAWRMFGLCTCSAGVIATSVGGVAGLVLGLRHPPMVWAAVLEGSAIAAVPGLVLGALVGVVLSWDAYHQVSGLA